MPNATRQTQCAVLGLALLFASPVWGQSPDSSVIVIEGGTLIDGAGGSSLGGHACSPPTGLLLAD